MACEVTEIDGSVLEGGGQILRIAMTLSTLLGIPIRIRNIRAGRGKPGLMEQHLRGIELVRDICNGKLKGADLGSTQVEFWPGRIKGGKYRAAVKTAGSISLLLQVALPCTLFADGDTTLTLIGGTNAEMAPQIDFTTEVFRPIMEKFGASFDFDLIRRGYFPKGGGEVVINIKPVQQLNAVQMLEMGNINSVYGWSFVAGSLPLNLAHDMANSAVNNLRNICSHIDIERYKENAQVTTGNCSGLILVAETSTGCILGGSGLGKRNESPQQTGQKAANEIIDVVHNKACVDEHIQDQIILLMLLAEGVSRVKMSKMTLHTETAIFIAEKLTNVKFEIIPEGSGVIVQCRGIGFKL